MNLYLITQSERSGFDTFDAAVVAAESFSHACNISPSPWGWGDNAWASSPDLVWAKYLGIASPGTRRGLIVASFNRA